MACKYSGGNSIETFSGLGKLVNIPAKIVLETCSGLNWLVNVLAREKDLEE
jgi:hypothetical protein